MTLKMVVPTCGSRDGTSGVDTLLLTPSGLDREQLNLKQQGGIRWNYATRTTGAIT